MHGLALLGLIQCHMPHLGQVVQQPIRLTTYLTATWCQLSHGVGSDMGKRKPPVVIVLSIYLKQCDCVGVSIMHALGPRTSTIVLIWIGLSTVSLGLEEASGSFIFFTVRVPLGNGAKHYLCAGLAFV